MKVFFLLVFISLPAFGQDITNVVYVVNLPPEYIQTNLEAVLNSSDNTSSFNSGLQLGATCAVFAMGLSLLRILGGPDKEDL